MTPETLRKCRKSLGLSQSKLAQRLGLADGRTIRKWEAEQRDIPQAQAGILEMMSNDYPEWLICTAPNGTDYFIQHTIGPRLIAKIHNHRVTEIIWLDKAPENEFAKTKLIQEANKTLLNCSF